MSPPKVGGMGGKQIIRQKYPYSIYKYFYILQIFHFLYISCYEEIDLLVFICYRKWFLSLCYLLNRLLCLTYAMLISGLMFILVQGFNLDANVHYLSWCGGSIYILCSYEHRWGHGLFCIFFFLLVSLSFLLFILFLLLFFSFSCCLSKGYKNNLIIKFLSCQ